MPGCGVGICWLSGWFPAKRPVAVPPRPHKPWPFRIEYPPELPISARADEIVAAIRDNQVLVLAGETGSGKTTQIPKLCLVAGRGERGRIACTQPRRVAASSVARRVAEELNVGFGREVGCKIRFADQTSGDTVIKFMTDGMLLAELQADPELREYDTIIVDEAHERSLNIDFILGHLRRLRTRRPDLKIVITSATIDTEAFSKAFDGAPIIEVSGRVYPVEVIYSPLEEMKGEESEYTYLDAAAEAVGRILDESSTGDILVFLPTERDIRELRDLLEGRKRSRLEVVPLFGRLTNAEQQRVFTPTQARKIVLATNIAETSLTIPGIRFVVDTGLARFSRYVPQSRTRRLPVEPVSQSSADQRKGRCGRVSDGVCIRLYAEQDFLDRPRFTQPEIQRSNLADVILRMKAFGLGDIEEFPFLNAPPAKGIRAGYALLHELGAIDEAGVLTDLGRELAHLPVDPTVGRMILQARTEKALREVLIIAAALSIQDPRERPMDAQQKADAAHRRFTQPDSDFLTLLSIWEAYHDEFEAMTLGKLRKFCTSHFLSFMRMREWRDVHGQLEDTLRERDGFAHSSVYDGLKKGQELKLDLGTPAYAAIHRSILAGLLGNVATRTDEGDYHAAHDRRVNVFPGSTLFEKRERDSKNNPTGGRASPSKPKVAKWLMAAEIMETARLYARTCARVDPQWIIGLGSHLLRVAHSEPFWSADAGRVLVKERRRLYNLELETRSVGYGKINPLHATEIFIREALVGDTVTWPFDFLAHNRKLREQAEERLTRLRSSGYMNIDEALYRFYAKEFEKVEPALSAGFPEDQANPRGARMPPQGISSVPELIDFVRHQQTTNPKFLFLRDEDLRAAEDDAHDAEAFPEALPISNQVLPLSYAYQPGKHDDGVTVRVSLAEAEALSPAALDWAVPGHLPEKVELMLKALPKEQRRGLIPLTETAQRLVRELALISSRPKQPTLAEALAELLQPRLGVRIDPTTWSAKGLPDHLRVRVEVVDAKDRVLCASRELGEIQALLHDRRREFSQKAATAENAAWRAARAKWEGEPAGEWKFGDLPASVPVEEKHGVPVLAYPGIKALGAGVAVRLFATPEEAATVTRAGVAQLLETQLRYDLGWLEKDLRALRMLGALTATLAPIEQLQDDALECIRRWVCRREVQPLHQEVFGRVLAQAKLDLRASVPRLTDWMKELLTLRLELQTHAQPYPKMTEDLAALLPADFLRRTPYDRLKHLPRYLRGMKARADRWKRDTTKDAQRAAELAPFVAAARKPAAAESEFRWLVEEFRVSLFAQELGTAEPVSAVRLKRAWEDLAPGGVKLAASVPAGPAVVVAPAMTKKTAPLKSLGALDQLFKK
ncbi:ATP-dependent RNA helicase HrpA [Oleiharenicola lentus]|uniref:ATP-dependent RNA helicase HrpA n=1 Tax=Oleiharenicola lentus TaxID=2508720 RepID=A0A4Q1C7J2_9BACT|nr:ATP-dependent RNA helicase HrpA [Oleiharenicola lentus]